MNNKERDEKFLKSWLKKKINITTSTVVSFLITGAIGGGSAYGVTPRNKAGNGGSVNSVALGKDSTVDNDSVAVGAKAHASQRNSAGVIANGVAVGKEAVAKGSVSVGEGAYSEHLSVSIGYKAGAEGAKGLWNSIAIGSYSKIGETGKTTGQGIAIGSRAGPNEGAWAKGDQSISIGSNTVASGDSSVVIGGDDLNKVADTNASYQEKIFDKNGNQIGSTTTENKNLNQLFASLTGRGEILTLQGVNPIDGRTYTKYKGSEAGQGSVALGVKAVSGDIALAIGGGSSTVGVQGGQVNDANVTLSDGSTINFTSFAGATKVEEGSMVSFGRKGNERQLKNMAPGEISATSTDAINGSQLYSVAKKLGEGWKADAGGNKIGASTATSVKAGNTLIYSAGSNLQVKQTVDTTNGKQTYEYSLNKDLTGLDSVTTKKLTVPETGGKDTVIDSNGINAGGNKITNVAPGVNGTDAVSVSQLTKLATNTIQLGGDKATTTDKQQLNNAGGIKFNIVGENGITTKAAGDKVTIGVDTNTIGVNIKLKYKSNSDATIAQEVKLSDGLNFQDDKFTKASVDTAGKVKYDTVTQGITVTDGKAIVPATDGLTTAKDIANVVNNLGWKATAGGNVDGTSASTLVKSGEEIVFKAGDNLIVKQDLSTGKQEYTYKLNKDVTGLDSVTTKKLTVPETGGKDTVIDSNGINTGGNKITNVAPGGADKTKLSDNNIGSIVDNTGKINIKLGKELTGLTSAEFKNAGGDKTVINGNGLIVVPATPTASPISITKDGISVGDKVIKNVGPGAITKTSTDAINGSQLYNLASNTIQLGGDKATTTDKQQLNNAGGIKFNIVGENGITTKAAGDKVTIGANIKLKYKFNSDATTAQEVKLSDGLNFQDGNFTKASVDTQGKVKYDTVTQAIAPTADGTAQVAPGSTLGLATSADVVNAINNTGWKATAGGNVDGAATSTVVKNGQEVEFNAGDNLKVKQTIDSTTGKQTYEYSLAKDLTKLNSAEFTNVADGKTVVNSDGITISSPTPGAKDISVTKDGISAGNKVIKNVAAGVNDTDAVNVSQLKDVDNKITNFNTAINKGLNFKGNSEATVNKQLGDTLQIVGEGTKADSEYSGQNLKVVEDGGKLVIKMDKNLKSDTVTADTVNTNSVTVGAPGKDGVITVKDANGKDGVSINGKDGSIGLNRKDGSSATISTVQGNPGIAGTPHQVATLDDGMKYGGDTGTVINKKLNQQVNVVGGITDTNKLSTKDNIGVVSDGSNNLKVRLAKDLDGLESITVRETSENTAVVRGDGLTITSPSGNTVSLSNDGLNNGGNIIKNVAAGKDGTDAVNVDQLNQAVGSIVNIAGDTIVQVNNKVDKLGERVNKGLAGAAAMAGLEFMDIGINQATVAAAVGGYRGTQAVAVQATPTENTRVNAKVAMTPGSRIETMYSLGASYRFNWR